MRNEYQLMLLSVLKNRNSDEENLLRILFSETLDWELIGGQLISHRLGGYFLAGIDKELKKKIPKEIIKALELLVLAQKKQNLEMIKVISPILNDLDSNGVRYAALKGLVLNAGIYKIADRRSNDADLLVHEEDLDKLDYILRQYGYIQTFMIDGIYKEATRKEKLIQRMNYHDLVPYIKLLDNEFFMESEIDINFHFDSKENDITDKVLKYGTIYYEDEYHKVRGLPWDTNLAHLCIHFYREATNSIWTEGKVDVTLYKIVDIINVLRTCKDRKRLEGWCNLMKELNLQKAGYYTMHMLQQFFNDDVVKLLMNRLEPEDTSFLSEVKIEGENKIVKRTELFIDSAFNLKFKIC